MNFIPQIRATVWRIPKPKIWEAALKKKIRDDRLKEKSSRKSPLTPNAEGYPINIDKSTITLEDLELESKMNKEMRLEPVYNPFLMKGASKYLKEKNSNEDIVLSEVKFSKNIQQPPLLNPNARDATEAEILEAIINV